MTEPTPETDKPDVPNVQQTTAKVKGVQRGAGQPNAESGVDAEDGTAKPVEEYSLTPIEDTDYKVPGLTELEVVAEGTFVSSTGEILKTGDTKLVSNSEADTLLGTTVNGAPAFKQV